MAGFMYVKRSSKRAKKTSGKSYVAKGKKPKLGSGKRFSALKSILAKKGAKAPGALAAWIGRRKYGAKKFTKLGVAGRKRAASMTRMTTDPLADRALRSMGRGGAGLGSMLGGVARKVRRMTMRK